MSKSIPLLLWINFPRRAKNWKLSSDTEEILLFKQQIREKKSCEVLLSKDLSNRREEKWYLYLLSLDPMLMRSSESTLWTMAALYPAFCAFKTCKSENSHDMRKKVLCHKSLNFNKHKWLSLSHTSKIRLCIYKNRPQVCFQNTMDILQLSRTSLDIFLISFMILNEIRSK